MEGKEQTEASCVAKLPITLVLIGSNKSGKSSTGNSLLGIKKFKTGVGSNSTTTEIEKVKLSFESIDLTVIDTIGLTQTYDIHHLIAKLTEEERRNAIFALNIAIGRYTNAERDLITSLLRYYRSVLKRVMIIFTREDELKNDSYGAVEKWIDDVPSLMNLIKTYDIKYMAVDNKIPFTEHAKMQSVILSVNTLEPSNCMETVLAFVFRY